MLIGIDPDKDKSGVAVKSRGEINLMTLRFFDLFEYLWINKASIKKVRIEASWLIKHNWNKKATGSAAINARIGSDAGANHEVGRKIEEMCIYLSLPYELVKPLKKGWKGPDGKITHDELKRMAQIPTRTNQEQRDACLLIIGL